MSEGSRVDDLVHLRLRDSDRVQEALDAIGTGKKSKKTHWKNNDQ